MYDCIRMNVKTINVKRSGKCHQTFNVSPIVQALVPAGLTARKVFWSAVKPGQLTSYTVTTRLMAPRPTQRPPAPHLVVEHGTSSSQRQQEDEMVAEFLANMKKVS
jgi:hypothetical protein